MWHLTRNNKILVYLVIIYIYIYYNRAIYMYIYIYITTGPLFYWVECLPIFRETGVQSQVQSYQRLKKWYLMPPCLTLSIRRYGTKVKWSNLGNGVAPFLTPLCSSYLKGNLQVPPSDYACQLYSLKCELF